MFLVWRRGFEIDKSVIVATPGTIFARNFQISKARLQADFIDFILVEIK